MEKIYTAIILKDMNELFSFHKFCLIAIYFQTLRDKSTINLCHVRLCGRNKRGNKSFISHFSKYEVIYFYLDDKKRETLNFYAPDNIRWQIQKPLVHRH